MSALDYIALLFRQTTRLSERVSAAVETLQRDRGFCVVLESSTQLVMARKDTPRIVLPGGGGVIVGYLFDRATSCRVGALPDEVDQSAEDWVRTYWGGYIALRSRHATPEVLRDPSGAIPCYHMAIDDIEIVSSTPNLFYDLGLLAREFDWTIFTQALMYRDIKPARTVMRGVAELLPGVAGRLFPNGFETRPIWSPWDFVERSAAIPSFASATEAVAAAVSKSVGAWSDCFERPIVEVSGGLDSAIVAAAVARRSKATALTYAPIDGDPDETPYAQAVADHLGMDLAILPTGVALIDVTRSSAAGLPRPYARSFAQGLDTSARRHGEALGADAFFSGGGGDNVFCYLLSLLPAVDRIKSEGLGQGALATINDLAVLGNTNVWAVGLRAFRQLGRPRKSLWTTDARLLSASALETLPLPQGHPWTDVPDWAPAGKVAHVQALIQIQNHLEGHSRTAAAPVISPLLSQPIMETCLAIPSWLWCAGGNNRAVARAAFTSALPASIIARRSKGAFDSLAAQLLETNRHILRDLLLDGILANQGILDVEAVEAAFHGADTKGTVRLWHLADAEAWARSWSATGPG